MNDMISQEPIEELTSDFDEWPSNEPIAWSMKGPKVVSQVHLTQTPIPFLRKREKPLHLHQGKFYIHVLKTSEDE